MRTLLAIPSHQAATAVELIVRSMWANATFVRLARSVRTSVPQQSIAAAQCNLCVFDLLGLGWSQWSAENETMLDILLAGRSAVLFLPPGTGGRWLTDRGSIAPQQPRIMLQRPVSAGALREALHVAGEASRLLSEISSQRQREANIWMRHQSLHAQTRADVAHPPFKRGTTLSQDPSSRIG